MNPVLITGFAGVYALLAAASLSLFLRRRGRPEGKRTELSSRIASWWVMVTILAVAFALGRTALIVFFGFLSFLALKEYLSLIPGRRADRRVLFWAYLAIPLQYVWIADAWYGMFVIFVPVYMFVVLPARMILVGATEGFLRAVGTLHWGLMATVYSLGHAAFLVVLPAEGDPASGAELVFFLLFLVAFNDVAQYVCGRTFGRRPVVPRVSPKKTLEGLAGGVLATTLLGGLLAPVLTPLAGVTGVAAAFLVALAGFVGDVCISAVKRDLGIKDSGTLIPGHGGILDRVDSLVFSAPLFFHFVRYFAFTG